MRARPKLLGKNMGVWGGERNNQFSPPTPTPSSLWTLLNVIEESFECRIKRGELKCVTAEDKRTQRELSHTLGQNPWAFYQASSL